MKCQSYQHILYFENTACAHTGWASQPGDRQAGLRCTA